MESSSDGFDETSDNQINDPLFVPDHILKQIICFYAKNCADEVILISFDIYIYIKINK